MCFHTYSEAAGPEGRANDDNQARPNNEGEVGGGAGDGAVGNRGDDANGNAGPGAPGEPRRSIRDITWTFLTTFFTSLIPDMPQNN